MGGLLLIFFVFYARKLLFTVEFLPKMDSHLRVLKQSNQEVHQLSLQTTCLSASKA